MQNFTTKTVREIALEMPFTTRVFEEFKIDYCCGGGKMFLDACRTVGANPVTVIEKIGKVHETSEDQQFEWLKSASLTELIGHILEKHHVYTKDEIKNLTPLMAKVANRHGEKHQELLELEQVFNELCRDLSEHLWKEEEILFPYVQQLEKSIETKHSLPSSCFGTVQNPIKMMMLEHDTAGDLLRKMREISKDYKLPDGACASYSSLFFRFSELERDLHHHIHLENNLLFPKAIELEEKVLS